MFPTTFELFLKKVAVLETLEEMLCRVAGGTMSTRAARRSKTDSLASSSEETEDSDVVDDEADDEEA